jgi:hypothetical protein
MYLFPLRSVWLMRKLREVVETKILSLIWSSRKERA